MLILGVCAYSTLFMLYGYLRKTLHHQIAAPPLNLKTSDNIWKVHSINTVRFFYRAIYDNRKWGGPNAHVRIQALTAARKESGLFCLFTFSDDSTDSVIAETSSSGRGHDIEGVFYAQVYYTCTLKSKTVPAYVALVEKNSSKTSKTHLPVYVPPTKQEHEFGVCVCITYWDMNPKWLIEWFEFLRLMGVGEVNIYDGGMNNRTAEVFRFYENQGMVSLHRMPTPIPGPDDVNTHTVTVPASLNDCFWRNMYRYK